MDELTRKILSKDPTAILLAGRLGGSISPDVKLLTANEDSGVRLIALYCLSQAGGDRLNKILVNALPDESPSVRTAALSGLQNRVDAETYAELLQIYEKVPDPHHRGQILLLVGRSKVARIEDLQRICENEQAPVARERGLAALARLGEPDSRAWFLDRLRNSRDRELKRFLEYVEYIGQIWVLPGLRPVLRDKTPLLGLGVCSPPPGRPAYLRACDLAVNLIAEIGRAAFSFVPDGETNYTERQLAEAGRFLDSLA